MDIDLDTATKTTVSIFFILDGPKLEAQAILLATTLRFFNSNRYQIIAYASQEAWANIQRITFRVMKACDVEIRPLDPIRVGGRTAFNGHYPHGNKILAAAAPRSSDISVFLDSDTVCCAPLDFEKLVQPNTMAAVVSDYATGWYNQKRWVTAYGFFDQELPEQRVKFYRGRKLTSPPYYNAGMVGFREDVAGDDQHLGKVWLDTASRFDWDLDLKYDRVFTDQLSLPIAATRMGLKMPYIEPIYNYNIMRRPFDPKLAPKILHYHRFIDLWNWPFGRQIPTILEATLGSYLAIRAMRVFRSYYEMPRRIKEAQLKNR